MVSVSKGCVISAATSSVYSNALSRSVRSCHVDERTLNGIACGLGGGWTIFTVSRPSTSFRRIFSAATSMGIRLALAGPMCDVDDIDLPGTGAA